MAVPTPSIDLMMPYYGDVPLMRAAVRSVLAQTDPDWHLTVVDDGREPGVPEWFAELADPRISYLRNEVNLGISANFQKCVELAERDRLTIMGCDDLLLPNYVASVRALATAHPEAGLIQPGVRVIDENGEPASSLADSIKRRRYAPKELLRGTGPVLLRGEPLALSLLRGNWLYFPSLSWRTDAVQKTAGFRQDLKVIQDLALIMELVENGEPLVADDTVCFEYRRHAASESSQQALDGARFTEARRFFQETANRLQAKGWTRAARAARLHRSARLHALTLVPTALRRRRTDAALRLVRYGASAK